MTRRPWWDDPKPKVVTIKSRSVSTSQVEAQVRYHARKAEEEANVPIHPYEEYRSLPPIQFANHVLKAEGLLVAHCGIEFLNDKPATHLEKMRELNRVLRRLGLEQTKGSPAWLD